MKQDRPNLLLITTDEQRYDFIGAMGKTPVSTPNLDRLVREGAYHPHTYTVNPVCMPARCSMLTGLYSHQHGVMNNRGDLPDQLPTLPKALQDLGYKTALIGKEHFFEGFVDLAEADEHTRKAYGWDHTWTVAGKSMVAGMPGYEDAAEDFWTRHLRDNGLYEAYRASTSERMGKRKNGECEAGPSVLPEEHHVDYRVTEETLAYLRGRAGLEEQDGSPPFFLWTSFCSPHCPFDPPEDYLAKYDPHDMPVPIDCPPEKIDHYQSYLAAYCAMIEQLDHYVGRIVHELESQGLLDNTLLVFLSDHGDMMGDFGLFAKNFPYEGSSRVPFIARHPAMIPPGTYNASTEITDVAATFLEAAGAEDVRRILPESPSKSLLPLWQGRPPGPSLCVFGERISVRISLSNAGRRRLEVRLLRLQW